ncbi:hypothetical protein SAMN05421787_102163 [Virgibacillus pantothenticus]|nr:hypothetical protein SAMN05421787_102163 [Virgibacillus pantothenticus]
MKEDANLIQSYMESPEERQKCIKNRYGSFYCHRYLAGQA